MSLPRTLACVVAFNRSDTLPAVLDALCRDRDPRDVLVIDNASSDGTADVVRARPGIRYFNTGANLGGAGGFAWALELAIALGYDYAYLLDDDATPHADAIHTLEVAAAELIDHHGFAFLASEPVSERAGYQPVGLPAPAKAWRDHKLAHRFDGVAVDYAAFLGILIPLEVARSTPLPYMEFFIWCDDVEYTRRIARTRGAACLPASAITHESPQMEAADRGESLGWKYFYLVRNRLWLARWGLPNEDRGHRVASLFMALRATRSELVATRFRPAVLGRSAAAWWQGLFAPRPEQRAVGSLVAGSPLASSWLEAQEA